MQIQVRETARTARSIEYRGAKAQKLERVDDFFGHSQQQRVQIFVLKSLFECGVAGNSYNPIGK